MIKGSNVVGIAAQTSNVDLLEKSLRLVNSKSKSEALNQVCKTQEGYDSIKPLKCVNYQCFELLINQEDIIVNVFDQDQHSPFANCLLNGKYDFAEKIRIKYKESASMILIQEEDKICQILKDISKDARLTIIESIFSLKLDVGFNKSQILGEALIALVNSEKGCDEDDGDNSGSRNLRCLKTLLSQTNVDINFVNEDDNTTLASCNDCNVF